MSRIVIFLPENDLYPYLRTLCCIAKALSDDVYLLYSSTKSSYNKIIHCNELKLPKDEQSRYFKRVEKLFFDAKGNYSFKSFDVDSIITDCKIAELKKVIPQKLEKMLKFNYKGFDVGKIAQYDLVLQTKFLSINNISENEIKLFEYYILRALVSAELTIGLCDVLRPDLFLSFNPYTMNQVACFFARKMGVKFKYITANMYMGADFSSFIFSDRLIGLDYFALSTQYNSNNAYFLPANCVKYSWHDSFYRFYNKDGHIFSTSKCKNPGGLIQYFKLSKNKKTILAFTSSNDEMIARKLSYDVWKESFYLKNVFHTQIEWIQFLKRYADFHKDIQVIVRVHPREGNRQNGKPSEHLKLLQKTFTERTDNFVIIWADDPISSYDLLELADLCLVNWSTMGQECARVGIPVLTYTSGAYYVNSKSFAVANTKEEYEERLSALLNQKYTLDILIDAIRYNYWRNHINVIDCSDTVPHDFDDESVWPVISSEKASVIKNICLGKTTALEYNKKKWLSSINENTEKEERDAVLAGISDFYFRVFTSKTKQTRRWEGLNLLLRCIRKFVYLCTAKRIVIDISPHPERKKIHYPLCMTYSAKKINAVSSLFAFRPKFALLENGNVQYAYLGRHYVRWSPLLYKLGTLYKDN